MSYNLHTHMTLLVRNYFLINGLRNIFYQLTTIKVRNAEVRIIALEMWIWRTMAGVSWLRKEEAWTRIGERRTVLLTIWNKGTAWITWWWMDYVRETTLRRVQWKERQTKELKRKEKVPVGRKHQNRRRYNLRKRCVEVQTIENLVNGSPNEDFCFCHQAEDDDEV